MAAHLQLLVIFLLAAWSFAAPAPDKRGIDTHLLSTLNLMEQYASAAYCRNNNNSPGDKITCASTKCPSVQSANTTTLTEFASELDTDVTGYVALDHTNRLVVVSFRGSYSLDNWITNLKMDLTNTDICAGCKAHRGFWQSWLDARDGVLAAITRAAKSHPGYKLVTTGHSLGGAIATLAAAQLRNSGYTVTLYSFGAPRIGGSKISDYITKQAGGNYRVTHWNDPVPRLPPLPLGYVHISPEYYINKANLQSVGPTNIKVCHGSVSYQGNTAWIFTDIAAHAWYFSSIATKCGLFG